MYKLVAMVYSGSGSGSKLVATLSTAVQAARQSTLQNSITWEQELDFELLLSQLPRAARLVVSLLARAEQGEQGRDRFTELGWAALQLFSHDRYLAQVAGSFLKHSRCTGLVC